jgi:hypothetical protein
MNDKGQAKRDERRGIQTQLQPPSLFARRAGPSLDRFRFESTERNRGNEACENPTYVKIEGHNHL